MLSLIFMCVVLRSTGILLVSAQMKCFLTVSNLKPLLADDEPELSINRILFIVYDINSVMLIEIRFYNVV